MQPTTFYRLLKAGLLVSTVCLAPAVKAADFKVTQTTTDKTAKTLSDAEKGVVETNATLDVTATAITQKGAATGVVIENSGTIKAGTRAIDTSGAETNRTISVVNNGLIQSGNDTFRINGDITQGTITLNNSGTMSSQTGQVLDFASMRSANAVINIQNSGQIRADDHDAIRFGAGNISFSNAGQINAAKRGINMDEAGEIAQFTFENRSDGVLQSVDDGIRFSDKPVVGDIRIVNYGLIRTTGIGDAGGQAIDFDKTKANSILIQNYGQIETTDADAVRPGMNGRVENWGSITAAGISPDASSDGIDFQDINTGEVINHAGGTITGARHGITGKVASFIVNEAGGLIEGKNGSGINFDTAADAEPMHVVNYGTIRGGFNPDAVYGDGDGIDIDGTGIIENYGTIEGLGSIGAKEGEDGSTSEAIAIGGGSLVNGSTANRLARISGIDNGILVDDSNKGPAFAAMDIVNYGIIEGLDGYGIRIISNDDNSVENFGTIRGTNGQAVIFGDGNDRFIYHTGSVVDGTVDGGNGNNILELGDSVGRFSVSALGDDATYRNFQSLVVKAGSQWQLSGESANEGALIVANAQLDADNIVMQNADLMLSDGSVASGTGTFANINLNNATLLIDRNGRTNRSLAADASFKAMGDFKVDGQSRIVLSGNSTIPAIDSQGTMTIASGAKLVLQGTGGCHTGAGCMIFSAKNGINGEFALVSNLAFLNPTIDYTATTGRLYFNRNAASFESFGQSYNQRTVGQALDRLDTYSPLYGAVVVAETAEVPNLLSQLSGNFYATNFKLRAMDELQFSDQILSHMARKAADSVNTEEMQFWMTGTGQNASLDGNRELAGISARGGGFIFGAEKRTGNLLLGGAFSFGENTVREDGSYNRMDSKTYRVAAYGQTQLGQLATMPLHFSFSANYSWNTFDAKRRVYGAGIDEMPTADFDGYAASAFGELSLTMRHNAWQSQPYARVNVMKLQSDRFVEGNAPLSALTVDANNDTSVYSLLGMRFSTDLEWAGKGFKPFIDIGWQHGYSGQRQTLDMRFTDTARFNAQGLPMDENTAQIQSGLQVSFNKAASFNAEYQGNFGENSQAHRGSASLKIRF